MQNVTAVYKKGLCSSCTLCSNYCHKHAITYRIDRLGFYEPIVDNKKCVDCAQCVKHCPGINDLKDYGAKQESFCYGYSKEEEMRLNASSGGLTTELLCYLLDKKIVDYVTVVTNRMNGEFPKQILTNNTQLVRECRTSKYCPVSWNGIIEEIENCNGRVALIGLPCQINSVKHYYAGSKNNKIVYYISLFCNHTPSLCAADFLARAIGRKEKLGGIMNRGNGWPGQMTVYTKSGKKGIFPFRKTWPAGYGIYFKNDRCYLCNDPFAKAADIVMGDAYFLQNTDTKGSTFAIVRNPKLEVILNEMRKEDIIALQDGPSEETVKKYFCELFEREDEFQLKNAVYEKLNGVKILSTIEGKSWYHTGDIPRFSLQLFKNKLGKYRFLWGLMIIRHHLKKMMCLESKSTY